MQLRLNRRQALQSLTAAAAAAFVVGTDRRADAAKGDPKWDQAIEKGLRWVAKNQSSLGHWTAGGYPTAMTALAGTALVASGSTTIQGPYAKNIRKAVDYLLGKSRTNGLIGDPQTDNRYTYGHGYSMLFLSQVLGEEEDPRELMRPFPSDAMRMWPISTRVNKPDNDYPSILSEIVLGAEAAE